MHAISVSWQPVEAILDNAAFSCVFVSQLSSNTVGVHMFTHSTLRDIRYTLCYNLAYGNGQDRRQCPKEDHVNWIKLIYLFKEQGYVSVEQEMS